MPSDISPTFSQRVSLVHTPDTASCRNCDGVVSGAFCAVCGAHAEPADQLQDHAREWWRRAFGDGVLWGSVWSVIRHPGRLTRDWWDGRRGGRMSPVRMLFVALLLGTIVTVGEARLFGVVDPELSAMLGGMIYMLAGASVVVTLAILPGLLPADRQRTLYQHATFALYEASFQSLFILWAFCDVVLLAVVPPAQLAAARIALAPLGLAGFAIVLIHPVAHLRRAYDLTWGQASWRAGVLGVGCVAAVFITSGVLDMGARLRVAPEVRHKQMAPNPDLPTFQRVPAE